MAFEGRLIWTEGEESEAPLSSIRLTDTSLTCEWMEDGERGLLVAHSEDGMSFTGTYGYPQLEPTRIARLRRYDSNGETVFVGTWNNRIKGNEGPLIFFVSRKAGG
jgi:hypothetical protein